MNVKNMMYATAALVAGFAGVASAATAMGPICDAAARVGSTTYYSCSGSSHTALDISNGTCSEWNHRGMLSGSYYYAYFGGCAANCSGGTTCNGGAGNYYVVTGGSGWDFRQLHLNANASSGSKTCAGCALGLVGSTGNSTGAHVHSDNRQYGTRKSAWYTSAGTTCGSSGNCTNVVGYPTL
ncbi:peptidase M23 [Archangium sp.]|uniref:peptidase M23 n=1 Tax=Archangium sp. TaxID=1872627 RepID=UPI002D28AA18|nr:peptidase M23 [Archangium sp.]HYO58429.1 peptidase M23 [Archangium sp.]